MKNVLITGATGGIGNALVQKFHFEGYNVCASGTSSKKLKLLSEKYLDRLLCVQCDLADKNQVENLVKKANEEFGQTDILINNAGITRDNLFMRMKAVEWNEVINLNLNSNFIITKLIIKDMLKKKWGRIINISSDAAKIGNPGQSNYVASKSAIETLTKQWAVEIAPIRVNAIAPGLILTEGTEENYQGEMKERRANVVPLKRVGEAIDIANVAAFLVSEEASYVTGQIIDVDGGLGSGSPQR